MDDTITTLATASRPISIDHDSPGTMRLMGLALGALCVFAALIIAALALPAWPKEVAHDRVMALAWIGWLAIGGVLLWTAALCSPWIGRVSAHAGPVEFDVEGKQQLH